MTSFRHLTRADLDQLTRAELTPLVAQESAHWKRRTEKEMNEQDALAYLEFLQIVAAVHDARGMAAHLSNLINGHDDGYMDQTPGRSRSLPEPQ
ncbi:hypothetical protein ACIGW3_31925 [Streptomyces sp. NPDC053499]|uniref:hypothetical protein n=1 Tax=Streptomyces sp. NPDC053499 TaxID=3365707 RepID=UPI0037D1932D